MIVVNAHPLHLARQGLQTRRLETADRAADAAVLASPGCLRNTMETYADGGYALVVSAVNPCRILYCTEALQAQALQRYMDNLGLDATAIADLVHSDAVIAADMDALGVAVIAGNLVTEDLVGAVADATLDLIADLGYTVDYLAACPDRMLAGVYVVAMA